LSNAQGTFFETISAGEEREGQSPPLSEVGFTVDCVISTCGELIESRHIPLPVIESAVVAVGGATRAAEDSGVVAEGVSTVNVAGRITS